jgi:hypothetical protein
MADYAAEIKRLLKQRGCSFERQGKGDHEIWYSPITNRSFRSIQRFRPSTRLTILKQAGLPKAF